MADYFQLSPDVLKAPYSGEYTTATYSGSITTTAKTLVSGDTVELVLFELPAGLKVETINWAISATLGALTTATFTLRKKATNAITGNTLNGQTANTGTVTTAVDRTIPLNGASVTTTANGQGSIVLIPVNVEGVSKQTLQESYYLSLKIATTGTALAAATVFVSVDGEFVGTL